MTDADVSIALPLTDGRLLLRPWRDADVAELLAAVRESVDEVGRWLPWCNAGYDAEQAEAWVHHCRSAWQAGDQYAFAVRDSASGALLGGCGLNQLDHTHRSANLGYWVRSSCQRQGIAAAAARLVAHFGFDTLALIRLEIVCLPDNLASRRVAEKLGASYECTARQRLWAWGRAHDAAVHGLVPADLRYMK